MIFLGHGNYLRSLSVFYFKVQGNPNEFIFIFRDIRSIFLIFNSFFDEIYVRKQNSPGWDADGFAASYLGLFCLPIDVP